jgi:IS4 transposase
MWLYQENYSGKGRPKKYAGKVDTCDLNSFIYVNKIENHDIYTQVVYSKCLQRNIKIVLLLTTKGKKVGKSLLYSTDENLDASKIVKYYKLRFQIEFIFRDAKQYLGLTNFQTCKKEAINIHINASFTTLNLLKLIDLSKKDMQHKQVISIASWKRRIFNNHLLCRVFSILGIPINDKKIHEVFHKLRDYGCIAS